VLADGTFMLVDGNRRYLALKWLLDNGHDEPKLKAIVNLKTTTEEERIIQMFTTQDNKQLLGFETAVLIKRLVNLGYNQTEVAEKIGKKPAYVSQMLSFEGESPIVKQQVKEGKMSVGTVLALQKKMPSQSDRVDAVNKAVDNSKTGKRLTIDEIGGKAIKVIDLFKNELNKFKEKGENGVMYITAIDDLLDLITKYKL
jgi:ParB-like chromosome segregation protein Spo0J